MNKYEILYILDSSLTDASREAEIQKVAAFVTEKGGKIEGVAKTQPWGLRKFAYPIDYKKEGFYVLMVFNSNPEVIVELEHKLKLSDNCLRFKTARLEK